MEYQEYTNGTPLAKDSVLKSDLIEMLQKYFGFKQFRNNQYDVIENTLMLKDSLVIMPTGGGKSLCYQLPSLIFKKGLTIVISPLISLMQDQVEALKDLNISAELINSTLTLSQIQMIYTKMKLNDLNLLYIAPERLAVDSFCEVLDTVYIQGHLNLIAVDEAHCISEWGNDFRADYRKLAILKEKYPETPIMALTASATTTVRLDIISQLNIRGCKTFISSFDRPNLIYNVLEFDEKLFYRKLEENRNNSVIIYCQTRQTVEKLVNLLATQGYSVCSYHAGLGDTVRAKNQSDFLQNRIKIIVATIAFGMGIDKPDIRLVIHYNLPKSIEGYYQETGRAGRDGKTSECVLFYRSADLIQQATSSGALHRIEEMNNYAISNQCRRKMILEHFQENYPNSNCQMCDNCLKNENLMTDKMGIPIDLDNLEMNILTTVYETGCKFGETYIINVLQGRSLKKINGNKHNEIKSFGVEQNTPVEIIHSSIKEMINNGCLALKIKKGFNSKMSFATLDLKSEGINRLRSHRDHRCQPSVKSNTTTSTKPPKNVVSVAATKPKHTRNDTLTMLKNNKTVSEIVDHSKLTYGTIIQHLTDLVKADQTILDYLDHIKPPDQRIDLVCEAINQTGELTALKPLKERLDSSFSYDEIRLCRLYIEDC